MKSLLIANVALAALLFNLGEVFILTIETANFIAGVLVNVSH